jgi:hypothetical protein
MFSHYFSLFEVVEMAKVVPGVGAIFLTSETCVAINTGEARCSTAVIDVTVRHGSTSIESPNASKMGVVSCTEPDSTDAGHVFVPALVRIKLRLLNDVLATITHKGNHGLIRMSALINW